MGSDRARTSYDPAQQYRAVIRQQGRVTLEADENEAWLIEAEQRRADVRDIVGLTGTPDDGYLITPGAGFDFTIEPGTMYVDGERVAIGIPPALTGPLAQKSVLTTYSYFNQPDWLDPTPVPQNAPASELVYLYLLEQEISAVEDRDLKDVALGGPDTAQRLRLMQHVERTAVSANDCATAFEQAVKTWAAAGLHYDAGSAQLVSDAQLMVGFDKPSGTTNVCDPVTQGGYLGADNQLIRVQISAPGEFVWGYDNASFLYRVKSVLLSDSKTVTLAELPLDAFHQPRSGQCVQILRATAQLANGEYVAYACQDVNPPANTEHMVTTLARAYHPDDQTIVLEEALPASFLDPNQTPLLFVRVWEERKPIDAGNPVSLGTTGVNVTLTSSSGNFHEGDYWNVAVRPSTPTQVYPERLLTAPQPPDGPREWVCALAVLGWKSGTGTLLADCRIPFDDLTKRRGGGCCTVNVAPADLTAGNGLQDIVDRYRDKANVTICLAPGVYELPKPLRLTIAHSGMTIESCDDGADLRAASGAEAQFLDGLLVLERANSITLRGLRFTLPQVPFRAAKGKLAHPDPAANQNVSRLLLENLFVSVGLRAVHCALLTVESCLFRFTVTESKDVLGIGVFSQTECWGLRISRTRFVHDEDVLRADQPFRMLIGYALAPAAATIDTTPAKNAVAPEATDFISVPPARRQHVILRAILQDARFEDNLFMGLTVAALVMADIGTVAFEGNTVRDGLGGFWLIAQAALGDAIVLAELRVKETQGRVAGMMMSSLNTFLNEPPMLLGTVLVRAYPLPATFDPRHSSGLPAQTAHSPSAGSIQARVLSMLEHYRGTSMSYAQAYTPAYTETYAKAEAQAAPAKESAAPAPPPPAQNTENQAAQPAAAQPAAPAPPPPPPAPAPASAAPVAEKTVVVTHTAKPLSPLMIALRRYQIDLAGFEQTAFAQRPRHTVFSTALRFVANEVDAVVHGATSSLALFVWGDRADMQASLVLDANRLRTVAPDLSTAIGMFLDRCVVTGNVIVNEAKTNATQSRGNILFLDTGAPATAAPALLSLELYVNPETSSQVPGTALPAVAVTGNLFRGKAILPDRNLNPQPPPPMDGWDFFNTTI